MPRLATFFLVGIAVFGLSPLSFGDLTAEQRKQNLESFDQVWNTVRAKHWDPALGGLDWEAVRAELRPKIERASSDSEARAIITDMLSRLHLTHYGVIPGSVYRDLGSGSAGSEQSGVDTEDDSGTAGLDVRVVNGQALIFNVEPGSDAEKQGVRPGWAIRAIDSDVSAPMLRRVSGAYQDSTLKPMMLARAVLARLDGPVGNPVEVEFRDGNDRIRTLSIERQSRRGQPEKFGYMPESWLSIQTGKPTSDVGYIGFNYFLDPMRLTAAFQKAIDDCKGCRGMVVDVRGNPGGIGILATGLAGYFVDQPDLKLGTLRMRDLPMKFVVNPRAPAFHGPLAILIDGLSASTSEIYAGGLQDIHRARVFGTRSAGAALPSMFERLPNGDGFQFAIATYQSASGKTLEGTGVTPDEVTPLTRAALLAGHDPALDAAVRWIHQDSPKGLNP